MRKLLAPVNSSAANVRASIAPREGLQSLAAPKIKPISIAPEGGLSSPIGACQSIAPAEEERLTRGAVQEICYNSTGKTNGLIYLLQVSATDRGVATRGGLTW